MMARILLSLVGFAVGAAMLGAASMAEENTAPGFPVLASDTPNILFILTDDQDASSLEHMPNVQKLMAHGTTFEHASFSYPWCCPSRASMLRGQYPHTTGIWSNTSPH